MASGLSRKPAAGLAFEKYEGTGNDFIVIDADREDELLPDDAARLCDRHFGIGADGVLVVLPARTADADARMRVINADGSIPEMCGNGARCVALHLGLSRGTRAAIVRLETDSGLRVCTVENTGVDGVVTVDMGPIRVLDERVLEIDGQRLELTIADAGNPHAVLFGRFAREDVERLGPRLSSHPAFPGGTNVEFAQVAGHGIDLIVWERGVGITLACGTGACAAVAVARRAGRLETSLPARVRLPGGPLDVTIDQDGRATLRGPARRVFSGTLPTPIGPKM